MLWTILFFLFLLVVFLVFLKLSLLRINGRRVMNLPLRVTLALVFPLILVLVALFGSLLFLFLMALVLLALVVFLLLFLLGKTQLFFWKVRQRKGGSAFTVHRVSKKR